MDPKLNWAKAIDRKMRSLTKINLKLPRRTVTLFLYAQTKAGGLGLPNIEDEIHLFRISTAFKALFVQNDDQLRNISNSALLATAEIRSRKQKTAQDFLDTPADQREGRRGDITSLWSEVRSSLRHSSAELHLHNRTITCGGVTLGWNKRKFITSLLRDTVQTRHLEALKRSSDQGRSTSCTSTHPASNHWITTGRNTSFEEYRFALKARLNLLPTRTSKHRARENVPDCSCR